MIVTFTFWIQPWLNVARGYANHNFAIMTQCQWHRKIYCYLNQHIDTLLIATINTMHPNTYPYWFLLGIVEFLIELVQTNAIPGIYCDSLHLMCSADVFPSLQWRHNDHDSVSNHQPHGYLLNRLFGRRSKKTSKLRVTGLCAGNSPGPVNSPHKGPVTRKMFPCDDVIIMVSYGDTIFVFSCCILCCRCGVVISFLRQTKRKFMIMDTNQMVLNLARFCFKLD